MAPARSIRRYPVPKLHHALVRRYGLMVLSIVFSLDIKPFEAMTAWDQLPSDSCNLRSGNRLESNIKLQVTDMAIFVINTLLTSQEFISYPLMQKYFLNKMFSHDFKKMLIFVSSTLVYVSEDEFQPVPFSIRRLQSFVSIFLLN